MQSHLRKPRGLDVKVVARRLTEISHKIPLQGGIDSKLLDDHEIMNILARIFPQAWRFRYFKVNVGQFEGPTFDSTVTYFDSLEYTSDLVQASKPEGKRSINGQDDSKLKR